MSYEQFHEKIFTRYAVNKRDLPWRETETPYSVLVSEIMLQQTQVSRVVDFFLRFMKELPTIESLATADKETVLKLRSGLGYNSRALNLQKAAQIIVAEYDGQLPADPDKLIALPGIGPYTANSICAFAFNLDVPVIDTNIRRVYAHETGVDPLLPYKEFSKIAMEILPKGRSRDRYNALMDYGSLVLTAAKTGIKTGPTQSRFEGSTRQVRSSILKFLLEHKTISINTVKQLFPDHDIETIVDKMIKEGIIKREKTKLFL